jgi:hypothetical protein
LKQWIGGSFGAGAFNLEQTNLCLGKLKWARVTEAQLREVLIARDGYPSIRDAGPALQEAEGTVSAVFGKKGLEKT